MDKKLKGQLTLWDLMSQEVEPADVPVKGAINVHAHPIAEFEVTLTTGDLILIVSMIEDYIRTLDEMKENDIQWEHYYRVRFKKMSEHIQQGINYDYEKARAKCLKKQEEKDNSDIGGDAMMLALKARAKEAERKAKERAEKEAKEQEEKET